MMPERSLWRSIAGVFLLVATIVCCAALAANLANGAEQDDKQREQARRERLLVQMRELAQQTQVRFQHGDRQPQLLASPVFRYDDKPRRFLDATLWVWTEEGRPVAFEKIEAMELSVPAWQYCLASVSEELLEVKWSSGLRFRSTEPGIEFRPLPEAPDVAAGAAQRKRQARELAPNFSARIVTEPTANQSEAMRLLPRPIFEYSEAGSKAFLGAVFGLTTSGTNPDLLLLLEARGEDGRLNWNYALARMTTGGLKVQYHGAPVWEADSVAPQSTTFPTWLFFAAPRDETAGSRLPASQIGLEQSIPTPKASDR